MRIAYLDCASGLSGDMTLGALVDAGVDLATVQAGIDSLGLPSCRLVVEQVKKRGFRALQLTVEHEPEHKHRHLHHIEAMIDRGSLNVRQKELAKRIFQRLGEAEAKVHGTTIEKVHFHEVGAVDSISDIVGTVIALDLLGIERVSASPVPTPSRNPPGDITAPVAAACATTAGCVRTVGQVTAVPTGSDTASDSAPITDHTNGLCPCSSFHGW